jgi:hypothetical protein
MRTSESIVGFNVAATRQNPGRLLTTRVPAARCQFPATLCVNVTVVFDSDRDDNASHDVCAVTVAVGIKAFGIKETDVSAPAINAACTIFMILPANLQTRS